MANESLIANSEISSSLNLMEFISKEFITNLIIAVILLILGFIIGKIVKLILKKFLERSGIKKDSKHNFYYLFLTIIEWSIYVLFINFALIQLDISALTEWLTSILFVIPAITGALLLISVGFAIATYLKDLIEDSKIEGWEGLSKIFYYFVLYVFMVFAFKTALISINRDIVNILLIALTIIVSVGIVISHFVKNSHTKFRSS
ncbi:MAG: hypothetical protein ABIH72_00790 [archaeon]